MDRVGVTMNDSIKMLVQMTVTELEQVIESAVERALSKQKPAKVQFSAKEVSAMTGLPESWISAKARTGEIHSRKYGHYRMFSLQDVEELIATAAAKNGDDPSQTIPGKQSVD